MNSSLTSTRRGFVFDSILIIDTNRKNYDLHSNSDCVRTIACSSGNVWNAAIDSPRLLASIGPGSRRRQQAMPASEDMKQVVRRGVERQFLMQVAEDFRVEPFDRETGLVLDRRPLPDRGRTLATDPRLIQGADLRRLELRPGENLRQSDVSRRPEDGMPPFNDPHVRIPPGARHAAECPGREQIGMDRSTERPERTGRPPPTGRN